MRPPFTGRNFPLRQAFFRTDRPTDRETALPLAHTAQLVPGARKKWLRNRRQVRKASKERPYAPSPSFSSTCECFDFDMDRRESDCGL